jgi:hypothetical protein
VTVVLRLCIIEQDVPTVEAEDADQGFATT